MKRHSFLKAFVLASALALFAAPALYAQTEPTPQEATADAAPKIVGEKNPPSDFPKDNSREAYMWLSLIRDSYRQELLNAFYPLVSTDAPERGYPEIYWGYVGERGRLSDEQIEALRVMADSRLGYFALTPKGREFILHELVPLSDADKERFAQAFGVDREELERRFNTAVDALREIFRPKLSKADSEEASPSHAEFDGAALLKTLEELDSEDASAKRLETVLKLPSEHVASALKLVLLDKPELFAVPERAYALNEYYQGAIRETGYSLDHLTLDPELETTVEKVLATAPEDWEMAYAAASIYNILPKTHLMFPEGPPKRCGGIVSPEFLYICKQQGHDLLPKNAELRYSHDRDRARVVQILDRAAPNAISALLNPRAPSSSSYAANANALHRYFVLLTKGYCDQLYLRDIKDFRNSFGRLQALSDLQYPLPLLGIDRFPRPDFRGVMGNDDSTTEFWQDLQKMPLKLFDYVENYADCKTDAERLTLLFYMRQFSAAASDATEEWQLLVERAAMAQRLLGASKALSSISLRGLKTSSETVPFLVTDSHKPFLLSSLQSAAGS